jgi:hypothetical protein
MFKLSKLIGQRNLNEVAKSWGISYYPYPDNIKNEEA